MIVNTVFREGDLIGKSYLQNYIYNVNLLFPLNFAGITLIYGTYESGT